MALVVTSNIESLHVQRNLAKSTMGVATSMQRVTSGLRINSAKDDAAGIQISGNLTSQINGLNLAQRNALLKADINDLKIGLEAIEERARNELGLIKKGETFYRILPADSK